MNQTIYRLRQLLKKNKLLHSVGRKINELAWQRQVQKSKRLLQEVGGSITNKIDDMLKDHFDYYICFGSLLGLVRQGRFLGHDTDIDIAIIPDKETKWSDIDKIFYQNGFVLERYFSLDGNRVESTYALFGLTVDVYLSSDVDGQMYYYSFVRFSDKEYESADVYDVLETRVSSITETKPVEVGEYHTRYPADENAYLAQVYGDDFMTPNPNWRMGDGPTSIFLEDKIGKIWKR